MSASTSAFVVSVVINSAIAIVVLLAFSYLRRRSPRIYAPRRFLAEQPPPPLSDRFFGWIDVLYFSMEEVADHCGLDALAIILFMRFGLRTFLLLLIVAAIMMAINGTASCPSYTDGSCDVEGLDVISLSNIDDRSRRMWAHAIFAFLVSSIAMYELYRAYELFVKYRFRYLQRNPHLHRAVIVQDLPPAADTTSSLKSKFEQMYPGGIADAMVAQDLDGLPQLLQERKQVITNLEHTVAANRKLKPNEDRAMIRTGGTLGYVGGTQRDKEDYLREQLEDLNGKIALKQSELRGDPQYLPTGVVMFNSMELAMSASQTVHSVQPHTLQTTLAGAPRDLFWENFVYRFPQRLFRHVVVIILTALLILFWAIPVTFVASLTTLSALSDIDGLGWIDSIVSLSPVLKGFLEGFLPSLALLIFMALLPDICLALSRAECRVLRSDIQHATVRKLYAFNVINVFLVVLVAGSIFDSISEFSSVGSVFTLLGQSIPRTGTFFTNYIMILALSVFPMQLLRIKALLLYWVRSRWLCRTPRDCRAAWAPGPWEYWETLPVEILVVVLGFTYFSVTPILVPFATIFFGLGYITYRYLAMYVFLPTAESTGRIWCYLYDYSMGGILLAEIALAAILAIKQAVPAAIMAPLILGTVYVWYYTDHRFQRLCQHLPLEIREDDPMAERPPAPYVPRDESEANARSKYVQPELLAPASEQPEVLYALYSEPDDTIEEGPPGQPATCGNHKCAWDNDDNTPVHAYSLESQMSPGKQAASSSYPTWSTLDPPLSSGDPAWSTRGPGLSSSDPAESSRGPGLSSSDPNGSSRGPGLPPYEPAAGQRNPGRTSRETTWSTSSAGSRPYR